MSKARPRRRDLIDSLAPLLFLVALCVALSIVKPEFRTAENLLNIGKQTAVIAIIALGETLVIISGGIDLSVGSVVGLAGVVAGWLMCNHWGSWPAGLVGIAAGAFCGFLNGVITVKGRVAAFIVTLGMLGVARGLILVIAGGGVLQDLAPDFGNLAGGTWLKVPIPLYIVAAVAVLLWLLLGRARLGRYTYALGGNREAARLSGVAVDRCTVWVYTVAGLCSGLAGVLLLSRVGVAAPTAGEGYELDAVAAAVIGGTSLMGGEGGIPGTLIGAILMGVLRNGCNLLNMPVGWQRVTIGLLIITAVFYDQLRRRSREKA